MSVTLPPLPGRTATIDAHKKRGGKVAAVLPIHQPRALFRAFDVLPVEVWGPPGMSTSQGDVHLQAYTCSIVRTSLSFLFSPLAQAVDLIVVPHACDSTQGLGSILLDFLKPARPVLPFYLPKGDGPASVDFLTEELRGFAKRLGELTGAQPSHQKLSDCIQQEETVSALVASLLERRLTLPMSDRELFTLIRAREYLPAEELEPHLRAALALPAAAPKGTPVLLSGIVPEPASVFDSLEAMGALVVADDLACTGRRVYAPGTSPEPFTRLAESLLSGPPDTTRGSAVKARIDHLLRLVRRTNARAAVFFEVKFCEPEQFYLPLQRKALDAEGVRSVVVEINPNEPLPDQVVTRLEALMETVA